MKLTLPHKQRFRLKSTFKLAILRTLANPRLKLIIYSLIWKLLTTSKDIIQFSIKKEVYN